MKKLIQAVSLPMIYLSLGVSGHCQSSGDTLLISPLQDSLEVALLRTTQTYHQVERLLLTLPPQSTYLNLLPSVLPVDTPLESFRVTSPFGIRRHPIRGKVLFHAGLDVRAKAGDKVKATAPGLISQIGADPALGVFIRIRHALGFETMYGHLQGYCVEVGQAVDRNQEIGRVGQTGQTTGPHLHYTIKKNGSVVDPFGFCFLLRRRLHLYQVRPTGSGKLPDSTSFLPSRGK